MLALQGLQAWEQVERQGDGGRQQLWERTSCPCLFDALVRGVAFFVQMESRTDGRTGQGRHVCQVRISCEVVLSKSESVWADGR